MKKVKSSSESSQAVSVTDGRKNLNKNKNLEKPLTKNIQLLSKGDTLRTYVHIEHAYTYQIIALS